MSNKDLRVLSIKGGGYANLSVVDVTLEPGLNKVGGKNRQGKSNLMELLRIFGGKEFMADMPLKKGEEDGQFTIPLGDSEGNVRYTVKYSFTKKNSYVKVQDEDGESVPLSILKELLSPCMDPNEFHALATAQGNGAKQRRLQAIGILRELMSYNVTPQEIADEFSLGEDAHVKSLVSQNSDDPIAFIDALDVYICENRSKFKVKQEQAQGTLKTLREAVPADKRNIEEIDAEDVFKKQQELQERVTANAVALEKGSALEGRLQALQAQVAEVQEELEKWRSTHEADDSEVHAVAELEKLKETLAEREEHNVLARKAAELRDMQKKLESYEKGIEARDKLVKKVRTRRTKTLEAADMPIEGLSIEGDTIMKHGIPLGQDSTEEGLTDAFMIGLAKFEKMHPDQEALKTMLISNASLMDAESKERMYDLGREHNVQLIVELVMDKEESGVIFVDNGVAVNNEESGDE